MLHRIYVKDFYKMERNYNVQNIEVLPFPKLKKLAKGTQRFWLLDFEKDLLYGEKLSEILDDALNDFTCDDVVTRSPDLFGQDSFGFSFKKISSRKLSVTILNQSIDSYESTYTIPFRLFVSLEKKLNNMIKMIQSLPREKWLMYFQWGANDRSVR